MSRQLPLDERLYRYLVDHSVREPAVLRELREETAKLPMAMMQIGPDQGQFMGLLAKLIGAKRCLEVGIFTGYSSLAVALALPEDGSIVAMDVSEEWTAIARRYWQQAGVADRIELRIAPAIETLAALPAARTFDFAFVDADKVSYRAYYDALLPRLRPNGLLVFDNVLWMGQVLDTQSPSEDTRALQALNDHLATDTRVQAVMISVSDGLTIVRKKAAGE